MIGGTARSTHVGHKQRGHGAMLARLKTFTLLGIEAMPVDVEVDISPAAMPKTILVGLPDTAVKESTHRVERAIVNSGFIRPHRWSEIPCSAGDLLT